MVDLEALEALARDVPSVYSEHVLPLCSELRQLRGIVNESLSEDEKEIALAQACEFAEYVERQAKGAMVEAARKFLSLPYAQTLATELRTLRALKARVEAAPVAIADACLSDCSVIANVPYDWAGKRVRLVVESEDEG